MSTSSSKMFVDQISFLSSSKKPVVSLSMPLFHSNASSEVLIRDDPLDAIFAPNISKVSELLPNTANRLICPPLPLCSTTFATVRQTEQQHTSVFTGLPTLEVRCVMELIEMQFRDFHFSGTSIIQFRE